MAHARGALRLPANGLVFDAVEAGPPDGPLVLLLHGFPQSGAEWRHLQPVLAGRGLRVVAPDQRGYSPGARPDGVEAYHVDHLVADVVAMADMLGARRFHLIGHDWGGVVAWAVAARHPDRLLTLTSVSTPHPLALLAAIGSPDSDQAQRSSYIQVLQQPDIAERLLVERFGEYVAPVLREGAGLTAALNWYRALDVASLAGVSTVTVPTLYVWSDGDFALGRDAAEWTAQYVSAPYRFVELPGVSHWIPEEAPDALAEVVVEHLVQ